MEKELVKYLREYSANVQCLETAERYTYLGVSPTNPDFMLVRRKAHLSWDEENGCTVWLKDEDIEVDIASVIPYDTVPFITPRYERLFVVKNLDCVLFDGKVVRVVAMDSSDSDSAYHFRFEPINGSEGSYGCWHICEFAERVNEGGNRVKPCSE